MQASPCGSVAIAKRLQGQGSARLTFRRLQPGCRASNSKPGGGGGFEARLSDVLTMYSGKTAEALLARAE